MLDGLVGNGNRLLVHVSSGNRLFVHVSPGDGLLIHVPLGGSILGRLVGHGGGLLVHAWVSSDLGNPHSIVGNAGWFWTCRWLFIQGGGVVHGGVVDSRVLLLRRRPVLRRRCSLLGGGPTIHGGIVDGRVLILRRLCCDSMGGPTAHRGIINSLVRVVPVVGIRRQR